MDREQRTDEHRTTPVRCSRTMSTNPQQTAQFSAWLEAVERFAVRVDDAPVALAALSAKHHRDSHACMAALLLQLSRFAGDRASVVIENGHRTARAQVEWGSEAAVLAARGWELLSLEMRAAR